MAIVESVNVGEVRAIAAKSGRTGIDKQPVVGPVRVDVPGPAGSGLAGDHICDVRHHGGPEQAVYAYAREDLDRWEPELGPLRAGMFGENLTVRGVEVTGAVVGERWRVGGTLLLEVSVPRIPCNTFAVWLDRRGWVRRFTQEGRPGTYLRVLVPGPVQAGDAIVVEDRPAHGVTVGATFRAFTTEPERLAALLAVEDLQPDVRARAAQRAGVHTA
ncbi:MOSC domain-containing protein [Pseudonocardia benzenivorans]|uniref:MOSC domain-containing protein n=1 Tax=Pseudonocardia benzenivorans TaxID=228005 RepID=A0ABW3VNM6_9PSEU|nr:MOSC domain-containing protein [Pseudonocardia dioxanivorans]GJF05532.1 sulfurase [Pseudonocardia sp. D17]